MAFGMMGSGSSSSGFPLALVVGALVVGLILGYLATNYLLTAGGTTGTVTARLSSEDRNFLVQRFVDVANAQIDLTTRLTAQQAAGLDWCTAGGGVWLTNQRAAQVNVTAQQAQQLQKQGAQVLQKDGNFLATVELFDRSSCVVVPTQKAQQQAGQG